MVRGLAIQATVVDYFLYLPIINSIASVPISISGFGVRDSSAQRMIGGTDHRDCLFSECDSLGELAKLREAPGQARSRVDGGWLGHAEPLPGQLADK